MTAEHSIGLFDAKTRLSELVHSVEAGEAWTITRRGTPVARLVPVDHRPERAAALQRLHRLRAEIAATEPPITAAEMRQWRDEGRR